MELCDTEIFFLNSQYKGYILRKCFKCIVKILYCIFCFFFKKHKPSTLVEPLHGILEKHAMLANHSTKN